MPTTINTGSYETPLADFIVKSSAKPLERYGASAAVGDMVENGAVKLGKTV